MNRLSALVVSAALLGASASSTAALVAYTDRASWLAAVSVLSTTTEDFNSMALGAVGPATVFPSGISLSTASDIRTFAFGAIGQGRALDGTNQIINLPGGVLAFGFDYADVDLGGANVLIGSFVGALPMTGDADTGVTPDDFGFYGVVATSVADIPGGTFSFQGEGFTLDNLSFATAATVPEPPVSGLLAVSLIAMLAAKRRRS